MTTTEKKPIAVSDTCLHKAYIQTDRHTFGLEGLRSGSHRQMSTSITKISAIEI